MRRFHAYTAIVLVAYASFHIANHLVGLAGIEAHIAFMESLRRVYRNPVVEAVLLAAVAFQIYSGATFVVRGWRKRHGLIPWLQAGSGAYLALFFLNHVGAVIFGRTALGLDTNFYFAAAGFHVPPFQFFFAPYYFLAVLALFVHLGCALYGQLEGHARRTRNLAVALPAAVGFAVSLAIVLMMAGALYPVEVPPAYKATYGWEP